MACELCEPNVSKMLNDMPSPVLDDWLNFYELEPFGARIEEIRLGALRAQLVNMKLKPNAIPYKANDFLVTVAPAVEKAKSVEQLYNLFSGMK